MDPVKGIWLLTTRAKPSYLSASSSLNRLVCRRIVHVRVFGQPVVALNLDEVIEQVIVKNFANFGGHSHSLSYKFRASVILSLVSLTVNVVGTA